MQSVQVLTAAWYGDREIDLTFPDDWDLNLIAFEERPVLTQDQLRQAFHQPIESPRIAELAQGKKSAVLIADDLTRPHTDFKGHALYLRRAPRRGYR